MRYRRNGKGLLLPEREILKPGICEMLIANQLIGFGGGAAGGHTVSNSADLEAGSSQHFTAAISGDVDKWTVAWWEKQESTGVARGQFGGGTTGENYFQIQADDRVIFNNTSSNYRLLTTATYTDTSNWHHWTAVYDSANGTAGDRMRLYFDGDEVTAFDTDNMPTSGLNSYWLDGNTNYIGQLYGGYGNYWDGLLAEFYSISSQALTPSSFISGTGGAAVAIAFTGSYGANDTYLNFSNGADLGEDSSGGGNDWTNVNSVTQSATVPPT